MMREVQADKVEPNLFPGFHPSPMPRCAHGGVSGPEPFVLTQEFPDV